MFSILIPFYNEAKNVTVLSNKLLEVLQNISEEHEIIFVDDGSTDSSAQELQPKLSEGTIKLFRHAKRLGKGAALNTGLRKAKGDIIVFMDADMQDDPEDLALFVNKIHEGYDFVNGIREKRQDNPIIKVYSKLANAFLNLFLRSPFTDINCGFKAFRRSILNDVVLYANNFRFLPLAAYYNGYKVTEIPVRNNPRLHGKSKFGIQKLFIGIFDTLTAYFLYKFAEKPLHFFGVVGGVFFTIGIVTGVILSIQRIFYNMLLYRRPALLFAVVMVIVGLQIIVTGIIGELIVYLDKKKNI